MPKYMHSLKRPPLVLQIVLLQNIAALRLRLLRENWPFRQVRLISGALGHRSNVRVPGRWLLPSSLPTIFQAVFKHTTWLPCDNIRLSQEFKSGGSLMVGDRRSIDDS